MIPNLARMLQKCQDYSFTVSELLRGDVHTQNVKMTYSVEPTYATLKISGVTKYFFAVKHPS